MGTENPRLAAHAALLAGLHANAAVSILAVPTVKGRKRGGKVTGERTAKAAAKHDSDIVKYRRQWEMSDELQDEFRSIAAYVASQTKIKRRTVERRLEKIAAK